MNQTYKCIECIIVDDCSIDDSVDKCERLIDAYDGPIKFKILHHEQNRGLSDARNSGTKVASGDYLYYLDRDDEITPEYIEKLITVAQKQPDAEMVIGNTLMIDVDGTESFFHNERTPLSIRTNELVVSCYYNQLISDAAWNKLVKRSFIIDNNLYFKEGVLFEDYLWMFYVVKYFSVVFYVLDVTHHYLLRQGSISTASNSIKIGSNYWIIFDDILNNLTPGRECMEMSRYVDRYTKCYLSYKAIVPEYNELHRLFKERARQYQCCYVRFVLSIVGVVGRWGISIAFLEKINTVRWRLKKGIGGIGKKMKIM